jgi:hypothetical protein
MLDSRPNTLFMSDDAWAVVPGLHRLTVYGLTRQASSAASSSAASAATAVDVICIETWSEVPWDDAVLERIITACLGPDVLDKTMAAYRKTKAPPVGQVLDAACDCDLWKEWHRVYAALQTVDNERDSDFLAPQFARHPVALTYFGSRCLSFLCRCWGWPCKNCTSCAT